jgi:hypothetical protein
MDIHRQLEALAAGLDIRKAVESVGEYVKAPAEEIIKVGDISQFEGCPVSFFIASALLSALSSLPHKASGSDVSALFPKEFMAAIEAVESLERPQIQWCAIVGAMPATGASRQRSLRKLSLQKK